MAAARGSASAEEVSRAAWTAMQVLRLPPLDKDAGDDPWAVPLAMLLRSLVEYPRWLVPTSSQGQGEVLQTLSDPDGQPLLVACADQANIDLAPSPGADAQVGIRGVRTMPGAELVYRWHTAQQRAAASEAEAAAQQQPVEERAGVLSGAVINPAASGGADAVLTRMVLYIRKQSAVACESVGLFLTDCLCVYM
jgi:hypothetical protein